MKLTIKQENFCNYYIETGSASEAYRRAYSCDNMKDSTIHRKAHEMLENGKITARVQEIQSRLKEQSDITKEEALKELSNIVRGRVTDVLTARGKTVTVKSLKDLPDEVVACIASVKSVRGGVEVKLYDKVSAIDRLSRMLGWDAPKEINQKIDFEKLTDEEINKIINRL